jgi:hypothetical protein
MALVQDRPAMSTVSYIMMQDRLSTGGSFILCDGNTFGFPIAYASAGFCDLFEYNAAECKGVKCGDLVAAKSIIANDPDLKHTSEFAGVTPEELRAGIDLMTAYTGNECKQIIDEAGKVSFSLVLNRRKGGALFVCELVMLMHRYPSLGWSYFVGFQRDISQDISVTQLLRAAQSQEDYLSLVRQRDAHVTKHIKGLGVLGEDTLQYLHEKASEAWVDKFLMMQVLSNPDDSEENQQFAPLPASLCSTRTEENENSATSESDVSGNPAGHPVPGTNWKRVPTPPTAGGQQPGKGAADTPKLIVGKWHGVVSPELGGHEQAVEFSKDGCSARITIFGKTIDGTYTLNCGEEPHQLTLMLPVPTYADIGGPQVHPVACIVKLENDELHFCQAHASPERPKTFAGPGYCVLRRVKPMGSDVSTEAPKSSSMRSRGLSSQSSRTTEEVPREVGPDVGPLLVQEMPSGLSDFGPVWALAGGALVASALFMLLRRK